MNIRAIHSGYLKLDGGAMFGVVPKRMWAKLNPPDENNLCTWAMRCLLVETAGRVILFDTGVGDKQDEKFRSHFLPHGKETLLGSLAEAGVDRSAVTDVFLTHLHFDHCGGALIRNAAGEAEPTFPNAVYWSNRRHFDWAMQPNEREKASFLKENFLPLYEQGRMQFVETSRGRTNFLPGIDIRFCYGHTEAMMVPYIRSAAGTLVYCADVIPSQWHVPMPYVMAYDIRPLITLKEKAAILREAAAKKQTLFLEHDPITERVQVVADGQGRWRAVPV